MSFSRGLATATFVAVTSALATSAVSGGQLPLDPASSAAMRERMQKERQNDELQSLVQPFKVFDNLYFVGDGGVSNWLVTTKEGLVLLDANYSWSPRHFGRGRRRTESAPRSNSRKRERALQEVESE